MARKNLSPAEFCYATARRKVLYETAFPETKNGAVGRGRQKLRNNYEAIDHPDRYTTKAAELSGKSESSIQKAAYIGKTIGRQCMKLVGISPDKGAALRRARFRQITAVGVAN